MRVLVIGFGGIAKRHVQALRRLDPAAEIGVFRRTALLLPEGADRLFVDWDEAAAFKPDAALICSPTALHLEDVRRVSEMEVPFLVEKPAAASLEGLPELCDAVEKNKTVTYVACPLRFDPLIGHVRARLTEGEMRRPQRVRVFCHSYLPSWRPDRDYREIYSARKEMGGGVALDLIHEFDYLVHWFGLPAAVSGVRAKVSALETTGDDQCSAALVYDRMVAEVSLSYGEKTERRGFELVYEDHSIEGDLLTGELRRREGAKAKTEKTFPRDRDALFLKQAEHFLRCCREKQPSCNTLRDGMNVLKIVLQLKEVSA